MIYSYWMIQDIFLGKPNVNIKHTFMGKNYIIKNVIKYINCVLTQRFSQSTFVDLSYITINFGDENLKL